MTTDCPGLEGESHLCRHCLRFIEATGGRWADPRTYAGVDGSHCSQAPQGLHEDVQGRLP